MKLDNFTFKNRIEKLRRKMDEASVEAFLIPPGANFTYFTGMEAESMERLTLLIVDADNFTVVCPSLMKEQIIEETPIRNILSWNDDDNPYNMTGELLSRFKNIAVEGGLQFFHLYEMNRVLKKELQLKDDILTELRIRKDEHELMAIGEAVKRSEKSLEASLEKLIPGITEIQFSRILENEFFNQGLSRVAFSTIVSFGKNAAMPHHSPDNTKAKLGDSVVIDYGGKYEGYASDSTRTFFLGNPGEKMLDVYETVKQANEDTRNMIGEDTTYAAMDSNARNIIESKGYGKYFIHRLGHGLGLEVHEEPYLIPKNNYRVLKNSVFTIEPGVYIENLGGVRIEDTNYFNGSKCVAFNSMSRECVIL